MDSDESMRPCRLLGKSQSNFPIHISCLVKELQNNWSYIVVDRLGLQTSHNPILET